MQSANKEPLLFRYITDGKQHDLRDNEERMKNVETKLHMKRDEKDKKNSERTKIFKEITKQDVYKRELDDNLQLLVTRKDIKNIDSQVDELRKELSKFGNYQQLGNQRSDLQETLDKYRVRKADIQGRLKGFQDEVKRCQRDLGKKLKICLVSSQSASCY